MPKGSRFPGFRSPNYTQVPDELFDELLADLGGAELKVLLYVMRRTFGFKKGSDRISKSQLETGITRMNGEILDRGTGLSRRAVRLAVHALVEKNILLKKTHSGRRGHEATEYALNIIGNDPWVQSTPQGVSGRVQSTPREKSSIENNTRAKSTPPLGRGVPTQETVNKMKNVNVNASFRGTPEETTEGIVDGRAQALVYDILDVCGDHHSTGSYLQIARTYPTALVYRALSETKDAKARGRIRKSAGAYFTDTIARLAMSGTPDTLSGGSA